MGINNPIMPRTIILHHGYLSRQKTIDTSILPKEGYYKVVAVEKTRRNPQGTTIHVSRETRDELNTVRKSVFNVCGNRLTQDDVVWALLAAYKHTGASLCDW